MWSGYEQDIEAKEKTVIYITSLCGALVFDLGMYCDIIE
jgi:hypothetical protein